MGPDLPVSDSWSQGALKFLATKSLFPGALSWNNLILACHCLVLTEMAQSWLQKEKCTESIFIQEYFTFSSHDLCYIQSPALEKLQHLKTKNKTSLQWDCSLVTCFNNINIWINDSITVEKLNNFLQIKIRQVKWSNYVLVQVFVLHENMLAK